MTWDYRVVKRSYKAGSSTVYWYNVFEVYYDDDGEISSWSADPVSPHGESLEELKEDIERYKEYWIIVN